MDDNNFDKIELECLNCKEKYEAYITIHDGWVVYPGWGYLCSEECYTDFNSDENIRDRRIKKILDEIISDSE